MIEVDVSLVVADGQRRFAVEAAFAADVPVVALYGPSGSGKSLTLQALAGLLRPAAGRIRLGGRVVFDSRAGIDLPPESRRVGYVFQNYALFPHLTVRQNIAFGLTSWQRRLSAADAARVDAIMRDLEIETLAASRPSTLSGGQQQRVALARALVSRPDVLLLDEPFAALHPMLRARLRDELQRLQRRIGIPVVMITHDLEDAAVLADTMFVMESGRITRAIDLRDGAVRERELDSHVDPATAARVQLLREKVFG